MDSELFLLHAQFGNGCGSPLTTALPGILPTAALLMVLVTAPSPSPLQPRVLTAPTEHVTRCFTTPVGFS